MSEAVGASVDAHEHAAKALDWHSVVARMTDVQKLVHLGARQIADDVPIWRERLLFAVREGYVEAMRQEVINIGCPDPGRIYLQASAELRELAAHISEVATGIVNTYNYDLAHAILRIGEETPTANRFVYSYRLNGWEETHREAKRLTIQQTEASWAINAAKQAFHAHNAEIRAQAEVVPYPTVCPVCREYVAGNPYPSMDALYRRCKLPAHPRCPHHGRAVLDSKPTREQCRELWIGG